jgi:predicted nucleic acid-binding protein
MGSGYLLDSNVIIDLSSKKLPSRSVIRLSEIVDETPTISVITKIELFSLPNVSVDIVEFARQAQVISLDDGIVEKTIDLRKKYRLKLPDAVIAATALRYNLTLITHDVRGFQNIKRLKLIDPYFWP